MERIIILTTLEATYWKVKLSLDEIINNRPDRTDIIESMEATLTDLYKIRQFVHKDEQYITAINRQNGELRLENIQLKKKCYELENKLNNAINNLEL